MGYQLPVIHYTYRNYAIRMLPSNTHFKTFRTVPAQFHIIGEGNGPKMPQNVLGKHNLESSSIFHVTIAQQAQLTGKGMYVDRQI
jgi:hypothetical protein